MRLKLKLAGLFFCAAAMCNGAQAQPAAARHAAPEQTPVGYHLLLASSVLLLMFGRRDQARAHRLSKD